MPGPTREERLSFDDAQILSLESDAIKGHTGKLLVLAPGEAGGPLSAERLRERVSERIAALPRLRQRVEVPKRGLPYWVDDPDVNLGWHVAEAGGPDAVSPDRFRRLAREILAQRLDHSRPLWRLDLIPLTDGRTGMVGRIHHAMADGVSAIRTAAGLLFDPQRQQARSISERRPEAGATHGERAQTAAPDGEAGSRPLLARLPGALRRELRPGTDTMLDQHIGSDREIAWTVLPLERLKDIGHRAGEGVTVNDVVLAIVADGLRRWLEGHDRPATLKAQVPVCLHLRDADPAIGNRDSFLNVDLPLAEPDALEQLRAINAETTERKLDHDADTLYAFFHALGRFRPLYQGVTRVISGPREFALSVSNVPGPRERASILGHQVREFCSFAEPADRHALRVAVISLGGDLAFGLCSDPEAIEGLDGLAEALGESVAELEAAV